MSDNGTHFKNELLKQLAEHYKIHHHFTTPLIHFSNGTVERINRDILAAARIILSEYKIQDKYWPSIVELIQYSLNQAVKEDLAGHSAFEAFTGRPNTDPLSFILDP